MGEKKPYFDELDDVSADDVVIATEAQFDETTTSRTGATALRWVLTLIAFFLFAGMGWLTWSLAPVVVGALASAVLFSCMHVVLEWERSVVLRFGKFNRVAGPGLIFMIPLVEYSAATVDMRMRSTAFKAEHVLTADLVPVNVDAVLFWTVWDAEKACSEVKNYVRLVYWAAQTTLRDVMGAVNIAQLSTRREQIDREVADILERKTNEWGITVVSVEIRDIEIPDELQESLSAEARAEREYNARVILAEVEKEISEMFVDAARHLRSRGCGAAAACDELRLRQRAREGRSRGHPQRPVRGVRGVGEHREESLARRLRIRLPEGAPPSRSPFRVCELDACRLTTVPSVPGNGAGYLYSKKNHKHVRQVSQICMIYDTIRATGEGRIVQRSRQGRGRYSVHYRFEGRRRASLYGESGARGFPR